MNVYSTRTQFVTNLKEKQYDIVMVGAGLSNAVIAHELIKNGYSVAVIERRNHIAGNCYTEKQNNIDVHMYGAHIFRTSSKTTWDYVNQFDNFIPFVHKVDINYDNKLYSFPINIKTISQFYPDVTTPSKVDELLNKFKLQYPDPQNLEERAKSLIGPKLFDVFIKEYTEQQWGKKCSELPASIINRIPVRNTSNDRYFADEYCYEGIPENGYTTMISNMFNGCDVYLNIDYIVHRSFIDAQSHRRLVYSGAVDEYFEYCFGNLEWRTVEFKHELHQMKLYQSTPVVNFPSAKIPYTRIIEHKQFQPLKMNDTNETIISYEFSTKWEPGMEPYYPINDKTNTKLYGDYMKLLQRYNYTIITGRLGKYAYYDMDNAITNAQEQAYALIADLK